MYLYLYNCNTLTQHNLSRVSVLSVYYDDVQRGRGAV